VWAFEVSGVPDTKAAHQAKAARIVWSVDSPRRVGLTTADWEGVDVHTCFDAAYLERSVSVRAQLSVGAGIGWLPGCSPEDDPWPRRRGPDVSFVGSLGELRVRELADTLKREDPDRLALLDRLAREGGDPAVAFQAATGVPYRRAPCAYVDERRTMERRSVVLAALPRASLRIFGDAEWLTAGPLGECYAGHNVSYGLGLSSLYFHSKININVFHEQCTDSTNSRVYDVLAAGGFLLTEERPCLAREFQEGRHFATFSSATEAREKVQYYLAHEEEREEMAREGQRHVLAHHTFTHRCEELLKLVRPLIGAKANA
jgi:hypothetical protein